MTAPLGEAGDFIAEQLAEAEEASQVAQRKFRALHALRPEDTLPPTSGTQ